MKVNLSKVNHKEPPNFKPCLLTETPYLSPPWSRRLPAIMVSVSICSRPFWMCSVSSQLRQPAAVTTRLLLLTWHGKKPWRWHAMCEPCVWGAQNSWATERVIKWRLACGPQSNQEKYVGKVRVERNGNCSGFCRSTVMLTHYIKWTGHSMLDPS